MTMHAAFSQTEFVLKRRKLPFSGKYRLFTSRQTEPWLYVEEKTKWIPPSNVTHVYADEAQRQEVLTLKGSKSEDVDVDVIDAETGQKIGGISTSADSLGEFFKDAWVITDAADKPVAKFFEKSAARSLLRESLGNELPQKMNITMGDAVVGELRQKVRAIGYQLAMDFSMDAIGALDRRLGLAAGIFAATHQDKTG
jgi:hypothetical protein